MLESGERLPLICSRASGLPLFEPTLFSLTELRARNRSSSTIQQALRSVMVLNLVLARLGIDLDARLDEGKLLELGEIEALARHCHLSLEVIDPGEAPGAVSRGSKVVSLESARTRSVQESTSESVHDDTAAIRIRYVRAYLNWRVTARLLKLGPKHELYSGLKSTAEIVARVLEERTPASSRRNVVGQREGLSEEALARLLEVIEPTSPDNPWTGEHARERNTLITKWLLKLGVRRGELLGVRVTDINFQANEVLIARRADNPDDPRRKQPNTKTRDRLLPLDDELAVLTRRYITGARRAIKGARRHEYLIVSNGTGAPLSLDALNKIFIALRARCPDLPKELTPHVFRHTWNDTFSDLMDESGASEETEKKTRSRLMGWSETSEQAETYTRRHVQRKAREASLGLQRKLGKKKPNEP